MAVKESFYVSHGSPALATEGALAARQFLKSWKDQVCKEKPTAILVISAHWDTTVPTVNIVDHNDTMYDFEGFHDPVMYTLKYPAPGAPKLAKRVKELLLASGFERVDEDTKRGLDHGAWVPLYLMYPEADIPAFQLSIQSERDGTYHYNLGRALAPLKQEGVLILGSGSTTHNINTPKFDDGTIADWAFSFDAWLKDALLQGRFEDVNHFQEKAPFALTAHPRPDHFYPLHVAMGAAGENAKAKLVHHSWSRGVLSYASYQFSAAN